MHIRSPPKEGAAYWWGSDGPGGGSCGPGGHWASNAVGKIQTHLSLRPDLYSPAPPVRWLWREKVDGAQKDGVQFLEIQFLEPLKTFECPLKIL